jgi:hypothetical protein
MAFIVVSKGGSDVEIPDGVYVVTLVDIGDPRTVLAQRGPRAGQEVSLMDWSFALDDMPGVTVDASTSTASGPRSKMFAYLTALFGGQAPPAGTQIEKDHLIGRQALATIQTDEGGWPKIVNLGAMPRTAQPVPQAAPRPPAQPTDTTAMVKANERAARKAHPASENPVFSAQQGVVPGTGIVPPAAPVVATANDDSLPF